MLDESAKYNPNQNDFWVTDFRPFWMHRGKFMKHPELYGYWISHVQCRIMKVPIKVIIGIFESQIRPIQRANPYFIKPTLQPAQ